MCGQPFAQPAAILPSLLYALLSLRLRAATNGPASSPLPVSAAIARTSTRSTCFLFSMRFQPRANASAILLVSRNVPSLSLVPPVFARAWWRGQISEAPTSRLRVALSIDRLQLLAALTVLRAFPRAHDESLRVQTLLPESMAIFLLLYRVVLFRLFLALAWQFPLFRAAGCAKGEANPSQPVGKSADSCTAHLFFVRYYVRRGPDAPSGNAPWK